MIDYCAEISEDTPLHILVNNYDSWKKDRIRQALIFGGDPNFPCRTINAETGDIITSRTCLDIALSAKSMQIIFIMNIINIIMKKSHSN